MSQQPQGTSRQTTAAPSWDWTQVPNEELEVLTDNSKGTEQAKEVERDQQEMVKKQRRAKVHRQRAEEARRHKEEEHQRLEEEHLVWERAEQEWWVQEECERQRAEEAAKQAASSKGKGCVEELQREGQLVQMARCMARPWMDGQHAHLLPHNWGQAWQDGGPDLLGGLQQVPAARGGPRVSGDTEDREASTSSARKWAGTGGSQGKKKKRGRSGAEDKEVDKEAPTIGERELRHRLPPNDKYHGWLLVTQEQQVMAMEQQVAVMEQMAAAQEAQAVTIQVYVQAMQGQMWPPFPLTMAPQVGVPQGGAASATGAVDEQGGLGMREVMKSGGLEQGDLGDEQGDEMDDE
ncbi:hypothetical protein PISMIDRAFT_12439 [Pisolithus microcarpus 441]|uniref:Uncharacterized protein n=1 Tax=Pisolithus microcarpus 441 TaxID=765257 RepID=A0A0C9Y913_9AGAM|nr:hypothetical protein PISMIDRAFT_12439 [Pisolithus microcarpus 441]